MKLTNNGKTVDVPAEIAEFLMKKGHKSADEITLAQYDVITSKNPFPAELEAAGRELDTKIEAETEPKAPAKKAPAKTTAKAAEEAPTAGSAGAAVDVVDVFGGAGAEGFEQEAAKAAADAETTGAGTEEKAKRSTGRTAAQKLEDERLAQKTIKDENDRIGKLHEELGGIVNAKEALRAMRELYLINEQLPYFKTLTPSDTRLKAAVINTVPKGERQLHPALQNSSTVNATSPSLADSLGKYKIEWQENNLPQPKGFFVYVPEKLLNFDPSLISFKHVRQQVIDVYNEYKEQEGTPIRRVVKFFSKKNLLTLLLILEAPMRPYDIDAEAFVINGDTIYAADSNGHRSKATHTLRAKDHNGNGMKLSVRNFIPLQTYDTVLKNKADIHHTTLAFFKRSLFTEASNGTGMRYDQLLPEFAAQFEERADGDYEFTDFKSTRKVPKYDNHRNRDEMIELELPLVTVSGSGRVVFKKSKNEPGSNYKPVYKQDYEAVGAEIHASKSQTVKATAETAESQRRNLENLIGIFTDPTFLG